MHLRLKTIAQIIILSLILTFSLAAQDWSNILINGSFFSSFDLQDARIFPDEGFEFLYGWYNMANLRLKSTVNESLSFFISTNLVALSGFYASLSPAAITLELERLNFRLRTGLMDVEAGLIRIGRGYGYLFSPLEILNPKDSMNAMDPSWRPKGKWGIHTTFYPQDMWKIELFGLASEDPYIDQGWGAGIGAASKFSLDNWNFDLLYCFYFPEVPDDTDPAPVNYLNDDYTQSTGFAVKADIEIGLFLEGLYRFEHRMFKTDLYYGKPFKGYEGLEAALGIDYTFTDLDLYLLCEYLFYGPGHVDWEEESLDSLYLLPGWESYAPAARGIYWNWDKKPLPYARHDYLFLLLRYTPAQDLRLNLSVLAGLDDLSALATAFCEYDIVQGLTLQASVLVPVDRKIFDPGAEAGEWGSTVLGFYQMSRLGVVLKF